MDRSELLTDTGWGCALADVLQACPSATAADEIVLLRQGCAALGAAAAIDPAFAPSSRTRFETLLAIGAPESAALALLPPDTGYILSRGGNGRHIASVLLGDRGEHTVEGNTAALAIMAALLCACRAVLHAPAGALLN